ncbi:MAG: dihydrolipoamide acetyltransferase family protein [Dehalococcoidia bacterium]|nr:dihydrolipoamide acetyltransferase family protein [Dehalococcoidia bacterium]
MPTDVILPQWGMNMQEGTLVKWLKREGDPVAQGEPLVEVETAKINSELESPSAGVVAHILAAEGSTVAVGSVVAIIAAPGENVARPVPATPSATTRAAPNSVAPAASPRPTTAAAPGQVVPTARRLAQQHNLDMALVQGTGPGGRITEADVQRALDARARPAPPPGVTPLTGVRKTIAERMLLSIQTMAQVTITTEADVTEMVALRKELLGQWRAHRLRPMDQDLVVKAVARALAEHPHVNAVLDSSGLRHIAEVNIGVALALSEGLIVGVVHNANKKTLLAIAQEVREMAAKARDGKLSPEDVTGSSFTITSLASFDIDAFTPIINPPEVAILGVGRIVEKPAIHQGEIAKRSMVFLSLTFDHRALDGAPAAQFLQTVKRYLEEPRWMAV